MPQAPPAVFKIPTTDPRHGRAATRGGGEVIELEYGITVYPAPEAQLMAVENRRFLRRAVRYLVAEAGITQFLDIGTGLPTQGNVHQVAQDINPAAGVVYVDNDRFKSGCTHAYRADPLK